MEGGTETTVKKNNIGRWYAFYNNDKYKITMEHSHD
jgi:hypothetical protein